MEILKHGHQRGEGGTIPGTAGRRLTKAKERSDV